MDSRIVTDRLSRRSKGCVPLSGLRFPINQSLLLFLYSIGYVEFRTIDMVEKALNLTGTVVMGLPIMVQLTESERNKLHPGDGYELVFVVFFLSLTRCLDYQKPQSSPRGQRAAWGHAVRKIHTFLAH